MAARPLRKLLLFVALTAGWCRLAPREFVAVMIVGCLELPREENSHAHRSFNSVWRSWLGRRLRRVRERRAGCAGPGDAGIQHCSGRRWLRLAVPPQPVGPLRSKPLRVLPTPAVLARILRWRWRIPALEPLLSERSRGEPTQRARVGARLPWVLTGDQIGAEASSRRSR